MTPDEESEERGKRISRKYRRAIYAYDREHGRDRLGGMTLGEWERFTALIKTNHDVLSAAMLIVSEQEQR